MKTTRWIIPEAPEPGSRAAALDDPTAAGIGRGKLRIGLLDNTKDNARLLLELIAEQVRREFAADVLIRRKDNPATGASEAMLDELAREADIVLTAMAD